MSLREILRAVYISIAANKFRVFLTSLGIIVGAITIILVIGIGKGSQEDVAKQFGRLNVGTIQVMSGRAKEVSEVIDDNDLKSIKENCPSVADATMIITGQAEISYYDTSDTVSIAGVWENYPLFNNLEIEAGTFISDYDSQKRNKLAVIGSELAEQFFGEEKATALGEYMTVKGKKYEVIGVLGYMGDSMPGFNIDESIILPYEAAEKYVIGKKSRPTIMAQAVNIDQVDFAIEEISQVMEQNHKKYADNFMIRDAGSRLVAAQESAKTMSALLIAIATIVLIVGGIGIMNVLFVSVEERTKEIGILKAIGARRRDILLQFLLEAIIISATGGIIAIILGVFLLPVLSFIDFTIIPSAYGNIIAFVFSIATGTFFGYYPAAKAASLTPIEALRHE